MEILCRVPIKTLAACKTVCKSWLHLITDPHFSQLHQARAPTELCFQFYYDFNTTMLYMGNFNLLNNVDPLGAKLDSVFEFPIFDVLPNNALSYGFMLGKLIFANSCNGLLCYYGRDDRFAVVWNPCTSEFITFPAPQTHNGLSTCRGYGLGFSTKANKYKLLRVMGRKDTASSSEAVVGEICTIEKSCSWKTVGPCSSDVWLPLRRPFHDLRDRYATFLQGSNLHWLVSSDSRSPTITIHTFDFEDDKFGRVPLPPDYAQTYGFRGEGEQRLGVLAGCLYITGRTNEGISIWLMKEYGVQDSWTKLFCLAFPLDKGINLPIAYVDNGEVLMICTDSFSTNAFFYSPVLKSIRVVGSGPDHLRVIAFRPTLVLLKNSMLGYDVHVVKPKCADLKSGDPDWWKLVESPQKHGCKAPLAKGEPSVGAVEEVIEGHVSATSEFSASESSEAILAHHQTTEALKSGTRGESHGNTGKGFTQISTSVLPVQEASAAELARRQGSKTPMTTDETCVYATKEDPLQRIKTMEEVLEELRKEREQRQELEERLTKELVPLKEQTEQLKQQNQQLQKSLQDEHAKVAQLKEQVQHSDEQLKEKNRQMMEGTSLRLSLTKISFQGEIQNHIKEES